MIICVNLILVQLIKTDDESFEEDIKLKISEELLSSDRENINS